MNKITDVRAMAQVVNGGTTLNGLVCPACDGGTNNDQSFSITKADNGLIKFICFRAKCGYKGITHENPNNIPVEPLVKKEKQEIPHDKHTRCLSGAEVLELTERFDLQQVDKVRMHHNYWVFPVENHRGQTTGWVHKKKYGSGKKNVIYGKPYQMHWAGQTFPFNNTVVIVEDWLSAARIGQYMPCVALLGTNLALDQVREISSLYDKAVFMLDKDAWSKGYAMCRDYGLMFDDGCVVATWKSGNDPKDMSSSELVGTMKRYNLLAL